MQSLRLAKNGFLLSLAFSGLQTFAADVSVQVTGIASAQGKVHVALFASGDKFLKEPLKRVEVDAKAPSVVGVLAAVLEGEYAISVYQDVNANGVLDRNFMGIPKEPNGVSNNVIGKFGPPKFDDAKFKVTKEPLTVNIALHE